MHEQPNGHAPDTLAAATNDSIDSDVDANYPLAGAATPISHPNGHYTPRGVKRKASMELKSSTKKPSPPWKKFEPQNLTSFKQNGVRKSGRTNLPPLDLQPQTQTRGRRATESRLSENKRLIKPSERAKEAEEQKKSPRVRPKLVPKPSKNVPPPASAVEPKRRGRPPKARDGVDSPVQPTKPLPATDRLAVKSLRLRYRPPDPRPLHPGAIASQPKHASIFELLDKIGGGEDNERALTQEEARKEARVWKRLECAAKPGGALHGDAWLSEETVTQAEPHSMPLHLDFLANHVKMFVRELNEEQRRHKRWAKQLALDCLEKWQSKQPKTFEQVIAEARIHFRSLVLRELLERWLLVRKYVTQRIIDDYERKEKERMDQKVRSFVKSQTSALERRKDLVLDELQDLSGSGTSGTEEDIVDESDDEDDEDDDSDDSDDSSESEELDQLDDLNLTGEELRRKIYGDTSEVDLPIEEVDVPVHELDLSQVVLDEVDEALLDGSDEQSEEESDDESDESDDDDASESVAESDSEVEEAPSLLGFFSKSARKTFERPVEEKPASESISDEDSDQDTPATTVSKADAPSDTAEQVEEKADAHRTPVPTLLRGTLREYQHQGLDWLSGLYASQENGILADEMGLGKTIQTIALLAHLADKGIWGPHLIVVPTSVMLNWEMEFKKFCPGFKVLTYYGTQEERKLKRRGWRDNDRWHVCITSYQLALQDASAFKRRNWHYMVLDEAHNIKNFRSQRWQTMLTFKTQARLLLTGTPLQNNLTELWSLLFFLEPDVDEKGESKFKDMQTFGEMFKRPVEQILDFGREALDEQSKQVVMQLHQILRPHLLRRLKLDVEKQMPRKYEHIIKCRLSKRQRQLYDGYMGLAGTRESFASGNYMSIINCLMQLRKVCNHPDLFETRQIVTSFAMSKSVVAAYEVKELLLRRNLFSDKVDLNLWRENRGTLVSARMKRLAALGSLNNALRSLSQPEFDSSDAVQCGLSFVAKRRYQQRRSDIALQYKQTLVNTMLVPAYGSGLVQRLTFEKPPHVPFSQPKRRARLTEWCLDTSLALQDMFAQAPGYTEATRILVEKFGFVTPAVVAPGMAQQVLPGIKLHAERNPFYEAQTRLSIAFPDKSLIQYDCGKLQQLDRLLHQLQAGGHRALIFTQMTKVLDILEQFLNLHGLRYLRLDGATKVEQRQALTDQFNQDTRIPVFILSSRSGGLGINLTGADTVIFYDLDWNPAMDKQCQDRCHRIGQTRDVHIYRFVSEGTIEANILRKSNQKRMLDDVVIQEGDFTTDAFYKVDTDSNTDADAALDRVLGTRNDGLEQAEDEEDRAAARLAQTEVAVEDIADFEEVEKTAEGTVTEPKVIEEQVEDTTQAAVDVKVADEVAEQEVVQPQDEAEPEPGSYEDYMLRMMEYDLRDASVIVQSEKARKKAKKGRAEIQIRF